MTEAIRSIPECTASVTIATDPVTTPATSFSRISVRFEAIDCAAARRLRGVSSCWTAPLLIASVRQPGEQRTHGTASMADRVLLGVAQLGHRAIGGAVVGQERRVVAEAALAARRRRQRARAAFLEDALLATRRIDVRKRTYICDRTAGWRFPQQLREVLLVGRMLAGVARGADPGTPVERGRLDARVVRDRDA